MADDRRQEDSATKFAWDNLALYVPTWTTWVNLAQTVDRSNVSEMKMGVSTREHNGRVLWLCRCGLVVCRTKKGDHDQR